MGLMRWAERTERLLSLGERIWRWVPLMTGTALSGWISAWAARATGWVVAYGPIAWVGSAFAGAILFLFAAFLWVSVLERFSRQQLIKAYKRPNDSINPLDDTFTRQRIKVEVFKLPSLSVEPVKGKSFVNCELFGPGVILFFQDCHISRSGFIDCDFVKTSDVALVKNVIAFSQLTIRESKLYNLTILVHPSAVDQIGKDANWITQR